MISPVAQPTGPLSAEGWVGLVIGNSRLHWVLFVGDRISQTWNTPHLQASDVNRLIQTELGLPKAVGLTLGELASASDLLASNHPNIWIASVVPQQAALWRTYPHAVFVHRDRISLSGAYATLGLDRRLALMGALSQHGDPVLVIDGGTALTLTASQQGAFEGGAILPGLQLQNRALSQATAALPQVPNWPESLPPRWATDTVSAIQSGIAHSTVAALCSYLQDWRQRYCGTVVITGGDRDRLYRWLIQAEPDWRQMLKVDANLAFWGLYQYRRINYGSTTSARLAAE
ncbi:MAG: pantothenate kinase [Cyanobacteria bacterium P01_C01_bin.73]